MMSKVFALLLLLLVPFTQGFTVHPIANVMSKNAISSSTSTSVNMVFGNRKSKDQAAALNYWEGEWVCKDCGYIYNRVSQIVT